MNKMTIAAVIPAYKAQRTIERVIRTIPEFISIIVVVEDSSPDHTREIVEGLAQENGRIRLLHHERNRGVGAAVFSGYEYASKYVDIIVKLDSDGQMDPQYISSLIQPILDDKADYTKGNRFLHVRELSAMPIMRRIGNLGLSFMTKVASGYWNIFDPTNGFTALRTSILPFLDRSRIDDRYFFESSLLIELGVQRAVVRDVYIPARYVNEESSLSIIDTLLRFPIKIASGFLRRVTIQYFIRDFSSFSLLLLWGLIFIAFGLFWSGYHWWLSIQTQIAATTGTVMIGVLPIILGVQFLLQSLVLDIQNMPDQPISSNKTTNN